MKVILFLCAILMPLMSHAQGKEFRVMPEAGLSLPTADFKTKNVFADKGFQLGLHLDKFWGNFGVGLYGGIASNGINYSGQLPTVSSLISSRTSTISNDSWKQLLVGLGPIYKLQLSEKFDLELSLKVGFSKFTYPDYAESIQTGAPLNMEYHMYVTKNKDVEKKLNPMMRSALQFNFKPSERIAISIGANYTSARSVLHSYTFLNGDFNPEMSDEQLEDALRNAPTQTDVYKCTFNSIGVTLGVGFILGRGKDKPKDQKEDHSMEPPIPQYP